MKRFLLITGVLLVWTSCVSAADKVTMSADEYKSLMQRMDAMQRKLDTMDSGGSSARRRGGSARTEAAETKYDKLAQDMSGIYDTLDVVETKALQDRINFGAEVRIRYDDYRITNDTLNTEEKNHNFWTNRFRLNMNSDITRGLTFNGRLAVYKNWADSTPFLQSADYNRTHVPNGDTNVRLDRAYIDWVPNLPIPLAFTFGRQPSSEGPPLELKEDRKRQSTYPGQFFGGESDGIVMTLGLERYIGLRNSGLRFYYAKGFQNDSLVDPISGGDLDVSDTNVYATFFESEIPGLRDSLMVFSYAKAQDFATPSMMPNIDPLTGELQMLVNPFATNIGDMDIYNALFQFNNIGNIGLDMFVSGALNTSHPNGNIDPNFGGLLSSPMVANDESHEGWSIYAGFRYMLPIRAMNNPSIGFEYNKGNKYWFSFTPGDTEVYNKLGTRGEVYDTYYLQPFNKYLTMRVAYTILRYDYTGTGFPFGEPMELDDKVENISVLLDCKF